MFDDREQIWFYISKLSFKAIGFLLLVFCGLFCICLGLYYLFIFSNTINDNQMSCRETINEQSIMANIVVDISGAVVHPGIYQLDYKSRVADLVQLAGGFSSRADSDYLAKNLNLDTSLADGRKVYFPF